MAAFRVTVQTGGKYGDFFRKRLGIGSGLKYNVVQQQFRADLAVTKCRYLCVIVCMCEEDIEDKRRRRVMIFGHIAAKETEAAYAPIIRRAVRYCRETDVSQMGESRFELDGEDFIALICDRVTEAKEKKLPEVHRRYAELQYMAEGSELMGFYPDCGDNEILEDLLEEKDTIYYKENPAAGEKMLLMTPGTYAVFFPEDVHRPFCQVEKPERVKKIVVKIALKCL